MSKALITITFAVPIGYVAGDTAKLFGDSGSGSIDWTTPATNEVFDLFPGGAGMVGRGHAPRGNYRRGHGHSMNTAGRAFMPRGHHPRGHGTALISGQKQITTCGSFKFAFGTYDIAGNAHTGAPDEINVLVSAIQPDPPSGLKLISYNKTTDVLVLATTP